MRTTKLWIASVLTVVVLLAFAVAASATTYYIDTTNYAAQGWNTVLKSSTNGTAAVSMKTIVGAEGMQFSPKGSSTDYGWSYAGITQDIFAGRSLRDVTTLKMRTLGIEGDGSTWQPPTIQITMAGQKYRKITYLPWVSPNARGASNTWYEYDLLNSGAWELFTSGYPLMTWSGMLTTYTGDLHFATAAERTSPGIGGLTAGQQSFTAMSGSVDTHEAAYFSSARGVIDWVEIGFNDGSLYTYDFGTPVPEPSSIFALAGGLAGMAGIVIRRRK